MAMNDVNIPIFGIVTNPSVRSGRPIVEGTTIRVMDIVALYRFKARTPDDIASDYGLSLAQVHTALAYYFANRSKVDADLEAERHAIETARGVAGG
ncbi:MAG: DUF433 domain-containing protein [Chloroflexi bacterium]|nr:DUF433 domain-containing protein [Chloroflexota bacterium]